MSDESEVRSASKMFYEALNRMVNGDARPMADVWSHSATVTTMHPIGGRELGWEKVKEPWEQIARMSSGGEVKLSDQLIRVLGDMAYEVGMEQGNITLAGTKVAFEHRVTNVYCREKGGWKIVHHHTDVSPAMVDVLKRLEAQK